MTPKDYSQDTAGPLDESGQSAGFGVSEPAPPIGVGGSAPRASKGSIRHDVQQIVRSHCGCVPGRRHDNSVRHSDACNALVSEISALFRDDMTADRASRPPSAPADVRGAGERPEPGGPEGARSHVGRSIANDCWWVRVYPFQTHEAAEAYRVALSAAPPPRAQDVDAHEALREAPLVEATDRDPDLNGLPDLPRPRVVYADHSYPAYSRRQMINYARAAAAKEQTR